MIVLGFTLWAVGLLPSAQEGSPDGFGLLPQGAIVYGRIYHPGRGVAEEQSLLRDEGYFGLASALEEYFFRDRTEEETTLQPFGDTFGTVLHFGDSPLAQVYLTAVHDWGRGRTPESTRKAMSALREGEFAIYPHGKFLQVLHGDIPAWFSLVQEQGQGRKIASQGSISILEIDTGKRKRFTALLPNETALRSQDLSLLLDAVALASAGSKKESLGSSGLYRDLVAREKTPARMRCAIDTTLLLEFLEQSESLTPGVASWIRAFLRGTKGVVCYQEELSSRFHVLGEPDSPLAAILHGGTLSPTSLGSGDERTLFRFGWHLDLGKVLESLAGSSSGGFSDWSSLSARGLAKMVANFRLRQASLWLDDRDHAVFSIPVSDPVLLGSFLAMMGELAPLVPGAKAQKSSQGETEIVSLAFSASEGKYRFAWTQHRDSLLLARDPESLKAVLGKLAVDSSLFARERLAGRLFRSEGADWVGDLGPFASAWNGDLLAQVLARPSGSGLGSWLRFECGLRSEEARKASRIWESILERRAWGLQGLGPARTVGEFRLRMEEGNHWALAMADDRVRLDFDADFMYAAIVSGSSDREEAEPFSAIVERGLGQRRRASEEAARGISLEGFFDFDPLYEDILRSSSLFQGFLRLAQSGVLWPWYSLRSRQELRVVRVENGFEIVLRTNKEPGLFWALSSFFQFYRPSDTELRAMARALAIENAQRNFQALRVKDVNRNGLGEFADFRELLGNQATGFSRAEIFPGGTPVSDGEEWIEEGYRYRVLIPRESEERDRRWCLFVFPEKADFEHHLVFYIDERGILMAGLLVLVEQVEEWAKGSFSTEVLTMLAKPVQFRGFCLTSAYPPEHKRVYEYFLPYLPLYGGSLLPK